MNEEEVLEELKQIPEGAREAVTSLIIYLLSARSSS